MKRRLILGLLTALARGWSAMDDGRIWRDYLDWFRRQTAAAGDPLTAYREHLRRSGRSAAEAGEKVKIVARLMRERRDEWQAAFFDKTYSSPAPRFNTQPNGLLIDTIAQLKLKPGRVLDIHMGQGRNAVYLARQGWQVTGFDFSADGVAAALQAAKDADVALTAIMARHDEFDFGVEQWDLIVMSYTWVPLEEKWIDKISRALKPGGVLVFEHLMDESGSDGAAAWLPKANELPRVFARLRILRYEDVRARADWSWRPERIARLVAERDLAIEQERPQER